MNRKMQKSEAESPFPGEGIIIYLFRRIILYADQGNSP